jgi:hypothetical protein
LAFAAQQSLAALCQRKETGYAPSAAYEFDVSQANNHNGTIGKKGRQNPMRQTDARGFDFKRPNGEPKKLLLGGFGLSLPVIDARILGAEFFETPRLDDAPFLAGIVRMAGVAYRELHLFLSGARHETVAARASHRTFSVFRMYVFFHLSHLHFHTHMLKTSKKLYYSAAQTARR